MVVHWRWVLLIWFWGSSWITLVASASFSSNNELVRTQTPAKGAIVQVDAAPPFRQWYLQRYGVDIGHRKKKLQSATKKGGEVRQLRIRVWSQRLTQSLGVVREHLYAGIATWTCNWNEKRKMRTSGKSCPLRLTSSRLGWLVLHNFHCH